MLTKPDISDETIITCLHDNYGLDIIQVIFLPLGYIDSAVYRIITNSGRYYFLKLRQVSFNPISVTIPAYLYAQGIRQVVTPIATTAHTLWMRVHEFDWILYPFFEGKTGFEVALSKAHWITLGQSLHAIHTTPLPATLSEALPREDYAPHWRDRVRAFHQQAEQNHDDPIAAQLAAFWLANRTEVQTIVDRAEQLAQALPGRADSLTLCHSDLHGRNVLVGTDGALAIVDWDEPILALKERDLMFIGGGIGGIWNDDQEVSWFYQGYGPVDIDLVALCYYRYERIVADIAGVAEQIFGIQGRVEERQRRLRLVEQFQPNNVVDIAHRTYQQLTAQSQ